MYSSAVVDPAMLDAWRCHDPAIASPSELLVDLGGGSLPQAFAAGASAHPDSTLVVGDESFTLADLIHRSQCWATALAAAGVSYGQRVILHTTPCGQMLCAYLGLLATGATTVLTSPTSTAAELAAVARQSGAHLAVTDAAAPQGVRRVALAELAEAALAARPAEFADLGPDDVALIAFTSGTTGQPKGVPLTHRMLLSSIRSVMRAWRWTAADRLVHALPLYHQHGLGGVHATLIGGSSARLLTGFDPRSLVAAIRDEQATVLFGVPTIYQRLLDAPGDTLAGLGSLRLATSGSAPLPSKVFHRVESELGITPLERYGLTESGLDVSNLYAGPRHPGEVGYPLPGVEVRLVDPGGADVAAGQDGEIVLRGPQVFTGYLDDPDSTAAAFHPGGWFRTGDLGRFGDTGALAITGRLKDIIVTGGMNVSPLEVEEVLGSHPSVDQAAVTGVPDEVWGEAVAAWVVVNRPVAPAELIAHCRTQLASFKCPKRITAVDALPRNAMGKIQRASLGTGS